jgi:hypothetical protein
LKWPCLDLLSAISLMFPTDTSNCKRFVPLLAYQIEKMADTPPAAAI